MVTPGAAPGQRPPLLRVHTPGKSGCFGVTEKKIKNKAAQWNASIDVPGANPHYGMGYFGTKEEAARAYDAELRRRGWTHIKPLNFPDPADGGALPLSPTAAAAAPVPD